MYKQLNKELLLCQTTLIKLLQKLDLVTLLSRDNMQIKIEFFKSLKCKTTMTATLTQLLFRCFTLIIFHAIQHHFSCGYHTEHGNNYPDTVWKNVQVKCSHPVVKVHMGMTTTQPT